MSLAASKEALRLGRMSVAGLINSLFGYGVIFGAMAIGLSPYVSNLLGYGLGFCCSFLLQKNFVFASGGNTGRQLKFFLLAFLLSYGVNLAALHALLGFGSNPLVAQLIAAAAYFLSMYVISRDWVFKG